MKSQRNCIFVAIVGGSGSGKSWLADQLQRGLGSLADRLSLDDFYRDRSHLSPARRARVNFDHPRAIEWDTLERVLRDCRAGRDADVPRYDFKTQTRLPGTRVLHPKSFILMDGLWLLRRPSLRGLFGLSIFLDCPAALRLKRRLARDMLSRGGESASVRRQFRRIVQPMHARYVEPQARRAMVRLRTPVSAAQVRRLAAELQKMKTGYSGIGSPRARRPGSVPFFPPNFLHQIVQEGYSL